jgi:hypothetical protein
MSGDDLIERLDNLLEADQIDTRAGLYFMGQLVRDLFKYIEQNKINDTNVTEAVHSFKTRVGNVETALNSFLKMRQAEQAKAEDERKFYRRAVIGGIITIILSEAARWLLLK